MKFTPELISLGYAFAARHHLKQIDKAGEPYIRHPIRVALAVAHLGPEYELVGLFHDLLEDTECTLDEIRETWGAAVADGVAAMTHCDGEDYFGDYLPRVKRNAHARAAKAADARDNFNRLDQITDTETRTWLHAKYQKVLESLEG